ncbi:MAG: Fic family protein [Clostridiales bacterium]|nr:Fic family protein [Clostridiales bacterium]
MSYLSLKKLEYIDHGSCAKEYQKRYNSDDAHLIDVDINDNPAFFVETREIRKAVLNIHKMDKRIIKICNDLPKQAITHFIVRSLIDEVQLTNKIEGIHSTKKEISDACEGKSDRYAGIVTKYAMLDTSIDIPLKTCEDVRKLYDDLVLREVVEKHENYRPDGTIFRKGMVHVQGNGMNPIHTGLYPETRIIKAMTNALQYLNDEEEELLYRIAVFHYLIGYIHPFYDGNGRLNRFISSYMLAKEFEPLYSYRLSYTILENQSSYNKAFNECNDAKNYGELTMFVDMFLGILTESMENLIVALSSRRSFYERYKNTISSLPYGNNPKYGSLYETLILNELFSSRGPSITELSEAIKLGDETTRKMINNLIGHSLITIDRSSRKFYYGIDLKMVDLLSSNE